MINEIMQDAIKFYNFIKKCFLNLPKLSQILWVIAIFLTAIPPYSLFFTTLNIAILAGCLSMGYLIAKDKEVFKNE